MGHCSVGEGLTGGVLECGGGPHRWGTGVWGRASQVGHWSVGEGLKGGTQECGRRASQVGHWSVGEGLTGGTLECGGGGGGRMSMYGTDAALR